MTIYVLLMSVFLEVCCHTFQLSEVVFTSAPTEVIHPGEKYMSGGFVQLLLIFNGTSFFL